MADSDLLAKVEAAAKTVVGTLLFSVARGVNTGLDDANLAAPNIICSAFNTGEEVPRFTGNFVVTLTITINTSADDTTALTTHRADTATLNDKFMRDDIHTSLSSASGLHVYGVRDARMGQIPKSEKVLSDFIELDIVACSSDIT